MENHSEDTAPNLCIYYHVYLLQDIKFTGYVAYHFDTRKLTFNYEKIDQILT